MILFGALGKKEEDDKTFSGSRELFKRIKERERDKTSLQVICALFTCQVIFNT